MPFDIPCSRSPATARVVDSGLHSALLHANDEMFLFGRVLRTGDDKTFGFCCHCPLPTKSFPYPILKLKA